MSSGRDWGQEEKGTTEDEMAGRHHRLDGREFEWTPGVDDGQGSLASCDSWGHKESDTTERLNWTESLADISHQLLHCWWKLNQRIKKQQVALVPVLRKVPRFESPWSSSAALPEESQTLIWNSFSQLGRRHTE